MKYTKPDLEKIILRQLEQLEVQRENIRLLTEQNMLLLRFNHLLIEKIGEGGAGGESESEGFK